MNIPGFSAESSLSPKKYYRSGTTDHLINGAVVPALPGPRTCEYAADACEACIEAGGSYYSCPTCRLLRWCR